MKIWLFVPHQRWEYCGGMVVVTAESFERAVAIAVAKFKEDDDRACFYETMEQSMTGEYKSIDHWVLEAVYELRDAVPETVVVNYQYA